MEFSERMSCGVRLRAAKLDVSDDGAAEAAGGAAALPGGRSDRAAAATGDPGLASTPGGACSRAFDGLLAFLEMDRGRYRAARLAHLASVVLDGRCTVGSPAGFVYVLARSFGYDIPPYPLAGSGEIRAFFRDEGVANLPEWYASIGIEGDDYARLHEKTAVYVRGLSGVRTLFLLDGVLFEHEAAFSRFVTIDESGIARKLPEEKLARLLAHVFDAALAEHPR